MADAATLRVLLVPPVLVRDRTPEAPTLVLVRPSSVPRNEALDVSAEFLAMYDPPELGA